jgi:UDP-3-O-[3-hydroxymyristoyl] glucosamine N-acyltransferase
MPAPHRLTVREIATLVGGQVEGPADAALTGIAPLDRAGPADLSFLASGRYLQYFQHTSAGAVLLGPEFRTVRGGPASRILVEDPHAALARLVPEWFGAPSATWAVHASARLGRGTRWRGRVAIGTGVQIGTGVELGANCRVDAFATIGDGCRLGDDCHVESHATLEDGTELGRGVRIRRGARVGGPGFGFVPRSGAHERIPPVGRCILHDGVEIGANSTVDRGSVGDTVIGPGTKVDSLVHVGHNVRIGAHCLVMAQVGIAGSTVVEDDVVLAGQAGLAGHLRVGAGARVGAQAGVIGNVAAGDSVSGYPARPHREVLRQAAALKRLAPLVTHLEELARRHDG